MKDIFVSLEIAKVLEKIGFKEFCIGAYDIYSMLHIINPNNKFSLERDEIMYYAPTYEQVLKWFRDSDLIINLFKEPYSTKWAFTTSKSKFEIPKSFDTYEQAREEAILKMTELYAEQNS